MDVRKSLLGLALLLLLGNGAASATDFDKGLKAFKSHDYKTALVVFTPLAEQGDALAQNFMGMIYEFGKGDDTAAAKWYKLGAEQGLAEAQSNLGIMYYSNVWSRRDSVSSDPANYKLALKWFTLAAEQGYYEAQFYLGEMYDYGYGVLVDDEIAIKWYTKSAEQGG